MTERLLQLTEWMKQCGFAYKEQELMNKHTTFKIGGPCDLMVFPDSDAQIAAVIAKCRELELPWYLIGKGSDLLIADEGLRGVVIKLGERFSAIRVEGDILTCEAGASLASVCHTAYEHGLSGLEFGWGIPGTAGGALFMNAGAYGGEIKDVIIDAEHINGRGEIETLTAEQLELRYRHSFYTDHPECCILRMRFRLIPAEKSEIKAKMDDLMDRRKTKQPLEYPSAGSTFKRPEGYFAAALIEECGLKGRSVGDAEVSKKHSGFIINRGKATCKDVEALIEIVRDEVEKQTGCRLECEVRKLP